MRSNLQLAQEPAGLDVETSRSAATAELLFRRLGTLVSDVIDEGTPEEMLAVASVSDEIIRSVRALHAALRAVCGQCQQAGHVANGEK